MTLTPLTPTPLSCRIVRGSGDMLGQVLKHSGDFKGRGRLVALWMRRQRPNAPRLRELPGGGKVLCDLSIPYEAMVWLEKEEQADLEILSALLQPGQRFVDCGANIGLWSLSAAGAVGEQGSVIAFEPNPATQDKLRANIALSGFANITPQPFALSSRAGVVPFACEAQHNTSQIAQAGTRDLLENSDPTCIDVTAITLDEALRQLAPDPGSERLIAGCKIDVEGHELPLLHGAAELLTRQHPWLCIEFNTLLAGTRRLGDWDAHRYLRGLGYAAYRFEDALNVIATPPRNQNAQPEQPGSDPRWTQAVKHDLERVVEKALELGDDWHTDGYCNLYYI